MTTAIQVSVIGQTGLGSEELKSWLVRQENTENLGVGQSYIVKLAEEFQLNTDQLSTLLAARKDFGASLPMMRRWLHAGLNPEAVHDLYRTRSEMAVMLPENQGLVTLKAVVRFVGIFPEFTLEDDDLSEKLAEIFREVAGKGICRWVRYPTQALELLCDIAVERRISNVRTAIDYLGSERREEDAGD